MNIKQTILLIMLSFGLSTYPKQSKIEKIILKKGIRERVRGKNEPERKKTGENLVAIYHCMECGTIEEMLRCYNQQAEENHYIDMEKTLEVINDILLDNAN